MGRKWNTLCFKGLIRKCCEGEVAPVYKNKTSSWETWGRQCCSNCWAKYVRVWGVGSPPGHPQREAQAPRSTWGPPLWWQPCVQPNTGKPHVGGGAGTAQPAVKSWGLSLRKGWGGVGFASAWLALPVTRGTSDVSHSVYVFGSYNENEIPRVALCHFARQTESIYARCGY